MIHLRHFRDRHKPGAKFMFRRSTSYAGQAYEEGELAPDALRDDPKRLTRFWEAGRLCLVILEDGDSVDEPAEEEAQEDTSDDEVYASAGDDLDDDGEPDVPEGVSVIRHGGGWYEIVGADGESQKVRGKANLVEALAGLSGNQ